MTWKDALLFVIAVVFIACISAVLGDLTATREHVNGTCDTVLQSLLRDNRASVIVAPTGARADICRSLEQEGNAAAHDYRLCRGLRLPHS